MLRNVLAALALVSLAAGCAAAPAENDDGTAGAAAFSAGAAATTTCAAPKKHALGGDENGYDPVNATCASVTVDGKPCNVKSSNVALSVGLGGPLGSPGWTVDAVLTCLGSATLSISGVDHVDDYPQTSTKTFGNEAAASLDLGKGAVAATSSSITTGPTGGAMGEKMVALVKGTAHVAGHDVAYTFAF